MDAALVILGWTVVVFLLGYACGRESRPAIHSNVKFDLDRMTVKQIAEGVMSCSWGATRRNR